MSTKPNYAQKEVSFITLLMLSLNSDNEDIIKILRFYVLLLFLYLYNMNFYLLII